MASNGVIGITAQIMESSEITGTGAKKPTDPSMSIFQRISMGLKNIKKNFKSLVGNKSTGLLFLLLGSSQIARGLLGQVGKMIGFMLDILLATVLPVIQWILINVTKLINVIDNLLQDLGKWFKDIFSGLWTWVRDHAVSLWPGIAEAFGWEAESINVDDERDALIMKVFPELTVAEVETHMETYLVEGGRIDPSYWNPDMMSNLARPDYQGDTDAAGEANERGKLSWIYKGGASTPPGGYLGKVIQDETDAGNIQLIDEKIDGEDKNAIAEDWFSWTDDIIPFGWGDILEWAKDSAENLNVTPEDLSRYLFGTWESTTGEDAVNRIIDKAVPIGGVDGAIDSSPVPDTPFVEPTLGNPGAMGKSANQQGNIDMQTSNLGFEEDFATTER